jgi:triosephosphate isomerase
MTKKSGTGARRALVSGNWKMHHDHLEALHTVRDIGLRLRKEDVVAVEVSVHPPFTDLRTVQILVEGESIPIALGAQHCYHLERGAFTGEVSPQMLARLQIAYVLVGHSERRHVFHMSDEEVQVTTKAVLAQGMTPIVCVGETEAEHDAGELESRLRVQLRCALEGLSPEQVGGLVIAYEPVWAIGTGRPAGAIDAEDACGFLRGLVAESSGNEAAGSVRIQYGGSVTPENAEELGSQPNVDGVLVGGASLDAGKFCDIIRAVGACYGS